MFADCAYNVDPDPAQLAEIAVSCADSAEAFGLNARVAMISYATGDSNSGPIVDKVISAVRQARAARPSLKIDGPIQFDAAVRPDVAAIKCKGRPSDVAGRATVCVFPDLNTGNTTYTATQQASKCQVTRLCRAGGPSLAAPLLHHLLALPSGQLASGSAGRPLGHSSRPPFTQPPTGPPFGHCSLAPPRWPPLRARLAPC